MNIMIYLFDNHWEYRGRVVVLFNVYAFPYFSSAVSNPIIALIFCYGNRVCTTHLNTKYESNRSRIDKFEN